LDDNRNPIKDDNIHDIIQRFKHRDQEQDRRRTEQSFLVPFAEIKANGWDLSINRYKEVVYEQVDHDSPTDIITRIEQLDSERMQALKVLKELLA
jgi:type I restriction enzyme M protein